MAGAAARVVTVNEIIDGIWHVGAATGGPGGSFWFNAFTGWLWGPQIPGDALMQSRVMIRNLAGDGPPPVSEYRLGGEGVHDPVFPPENYDHDVVGYLVPEAGPGPRIELKNNQNSVSNYITFPWSDINAWIDLAMQYVGQICTFAAKLSTEPDYTVYRIIDRNVDGPPMPNTKWWGLKTYSNDATADVSLLVDRVLFSTPGFNGGLILPTS